MDGDSLDRAVLFATYAAAGEMQREVAETGAHRVSEADLRRAMRSGLQSQLGPVVAAEVPTPKTTSWSGRLGGVDVGVLDGDEVLAAVELKWCRSQGKIAEALWDVLKLAPLTIDSGNLIAAYVVYGAPVSAWAPTHAVPIELFDSGEHVVADLLDRHDKHWRWLLSGNKTARPVDLRSRFKTTIIAEVPIHAAVQEDWALKAVRVQSLPALTLFFDEGLVAKEQPAFGTPALASRFIDSEADIQIDRATLPENRGLAGEP